MKRIALAALVLTLGMSARGARWDPVSPTDLGAAGSRLDPDAPAELVFARITIDDSEYPKIRHIEVDKRFRIFDPVRATRITRLSIPSTEYRGYDPMSALKMEARLTLPNGQVREFGADAIHERDVANTGEAQSWLNRFLGGTTIETKERLLVVTGVERGSVLDEHTSYDFAGAPQLFLFPLQEPDVATRNLHFRYTSPAGGQWAFHTFVLHERACHAQVTTNEAKRTVDVTALNLPGIVSEPFSGPLTDRALTFVVGYEPTRQVVFTNYGRLDHFTLDSQAKPWSIYATRAYMYEEDRAHVTRLVRETARQVAGDAATPLEQARRIHDWTVATHRRFVEWQASQSVRVYDRRLGSPDDIIHFERYPNIAFTNEDFLHLEEGLDRSLGLTTQALLLPDRDAFAFSPQFGLAAALPVIAARVKIGDAWMFTDPLARAPLPFGALRASAEGQVALIATPDQIFISVPGAAAETSRIADSGHFSIGADGQLAGTAVSELTGHEAEKVRADLIEAHAAERKSYFKRGLETDLPGAQATVDSVRGVDDPSQPVRVSFTLVWPGYAQVTPSRLLFSPSVFHSRVPSPINTIRRQGPFHFEFRCQSEEANVFTLPADYHVEAKSMPSSIPGQFLDYRVGIAQEVASGKVHFDRVFTDNLLTAGPSAASYIKAVFDGIAARDQFELVAVSKARAAAVDSGSAP